MNKLTTTLKKQIDEMSREDMCRKWRFAPAGDPCFAAEAGDYFQERFNTLGGFSAEISKKIGW